MTSIHERIRKTKNEYYIGYSIIANGSRKHLQVVCESREEAESLLEEVKEAERANLVYIRTPQ